MNEVQWMPGVITLLVGLVLGLLAAMLVARRGGAASVRVRGVVLESTPGRAPRAQMALDDLRQEKVRLMRALRDLQDRNAQGEEAETERRSLELRAAQVFKELHDAESAPVGSGGSLPSPPAPHGAKAGTFAAAKWMVIGAFFPLVAISLFFATSERRDEMTPMTGGNPALSGPLVTEPVPSAGQTGGPVQGVPPDLRPKASPEVDRARARVAANPDQPEAWAELGWALVEAEGWIDVYETSRKLRALAPNHADGLVLEASVRLAMGQIEPAQQLVTDALTLDPSHIQGLSFQGALAMKRGQFGAAKAAWTQALKVSGPGHGFEELIAMADNPDSSAPPQLPADHPSTGAARPAMPPGHPGPSPAAAPGPSIKGSVVLAGGASAPAGGVLFIIARSRGVRAGPPAAVKRLQAGPFPVSFHISAADAMMGGALPQDLTLTARLDSDGNAGTRSPTDLVADGLDVSLGSSGVQLVLEPSP